MSRTVAAPSDLEDEFLERIAPLIDAQAEERLAAYGDGWNDGFAAGLEIGLRQVLSDAQFALGEAA